MPVGLGIAGSDDHMLGPPWGSAQAFGGGACRACRILVDTVGALIGWVTGGAILLVPSDALRPV